jgi:LysM repeat protein
VAAYKRASLDNAIRASAILAAATLLTALPSSLAAQSLRGSTAKLDLQNEMAAEHDFTYLKSRQQVRTFVDLGLLVPVEPTEHFELNEVSFPYIRPEVALFVDRLASQYQQACGQKLVVTSLTRPISDQPRNASARSVHPTGMAVDLRVSTDRKCRSWLESTLLQLNETGVLDATRENRPPHYHVVVFPRQYTAHVERLESRFAEAVSGTTTAPAAQRIEYTVRNGDSLWTIAQKLGTTVELIQQENDLRTSRIFAGQVISVPSK